MCWAYSTATMLRSSLRLLLRQSLLNGRIDREWHDSLVQILTDENHHKTLRSEIVMTVFPLRMNHPKEGDDLASISLVVDRVRLYAI